MKIAHITTILAATAFATFVTFVLIAAAPGAFADTAQVSEVVKDVSLGSQQASVGDTVSGDTSVKTGTKSRAELTFEDSTLLRIGSNTIFSFAKSSGKSKDFTLTHGTAFVSAPDRHDGVRINCGGVTAAITGSHSTVVNTNNGVGLFAATGNNSFVLPDGTTIVVQPFFFSWIPAITDENGNRVLDFDNIVTLPYDALAQIDTGWVTKNIPDDIRDKILELKNQLFRDGTIQNNPSPSADDRDQEQKLDSNTLSRDIPPPGADCPRCCCK